MRLPRIKFKNRPGVYQVWNRTVGGARDCLLKEPWVRERFIQILKHYVERYFCELGGFSVDWDSYEATLRFQAFRKLSRPQLHKLARQFYPGRYKPYRRWNEQQWRHFNRRIFDISELMRNVNGDFASWYNRQFDRHGHLWDGRFRSTLVAGGEIPIQWLLAVESKPCRQGWVKRPELWKSSSAYLRHHGADGWLMPLAQIFSRALAREVHNSTQAAPDNLFSQTVDGSSFRLSSAQTSTPRQSSRSGAKIRDHRGSPIPRRVRWLMVGKREDVQQRIRRQRLHRYQVTRPVALENSLFALRRIRKSC